MCIFSSDIQLGVIGLWTVEHFLGN